MQSCVSLELFSLGPVIVLCSYRYGYAVVIPPQGQSNTK